MDETLDQSGIESLLGGSEGAGETSPQPSGGAGEQTTQAAAWTSQLPKELRADSEAFSKIAGFKTIGELANAFLQKGGSEPDLSDAKSILQKLGAPKDGERYAFEKDLRAELAKYGEIARNATLTGEQAQAMLDGYKQIIAAKTEAFLQQAKESAADVAKSITDEFGADGAAWYRKAIEGTGLNAQIARSGLAPNKQLARALTLLGREMSEDYTPKGGVKRGDPEPATWKEGARFSREAKAG